MKETFETKIGDRLLKVTIGEMAKQASGACFVEYGDSAVLSTVCKKEAKDVLDFFPLMVIYQEKLYAAGKIPGGFLKREGRPTEHETLTSRLIDRTIRPMFNEYYFDEVQIVNTVLSSDDNASKEMAAMFGSSLSLMVSEIPFLGPIAGVVIGLVDNKFIINPTKEELEKSNLNLTVAGTKEAINMVEAGANFLTEEVMHEALVLAHKEIIKLCEFQETIANKLNPKKIEIDKTLEEDINKQKAIYLKEYGKDLKEILKIKGKQDHNEAFNNLRDQVLKDPNLIYLDKGEQGNTKDLKETLDNVKYENFVNRQAFDQVYYDLFRQMVAKEKIRPDGRNNKEVRPLSSRVGVLARTHGSSLFTRGETQSLGVVTLGAVGDEQIIDGLNEVEEQKRFMLHYNFPQFSVGETGRYGAPGRREIGHGALGERALSYTIPSQEEFPYTIRVVSEILESNGSSSQATICSGTMSLMDAGVPIKAPIAGVAMGLIMHEKDYTILTDIQGLEDHLGDMDFKVAGSKDGITALQMDIKIKGISYEILKEALLQAKEGRLHILKHMEETIAKPRAELSKYAPKVATTKIPESKIKDVIGSGGKTITAIIEKFDNVKIDIEQDGTVFVMHKEMQTAKDCVEYIKNLVRDVEVGEMYNATIKKIEKFGAFAELWKGQEGLIHISKLSKQRVEKCEDVVSLNDEVVVEVIKINEKNQVDLKLIKNITKEKNNV